MTKRVVIVTITLTAIVSTLLFSEVGLVWSSDSSEAESNLLSKIGTNFVPHWASSADWKSSCQSGYSWQFNSHLGFRVGYRRTRLAISFPSNQADFPGGPHFRMM